MYIFNTTGINKHGDVNQCLPVSVSGKRTHGTGIRTVFLIIVELKLFSSTLATRHHRSSLKKSLGICSIAYVLECKK